MRVVVAWRCRIVRAPSPIPPRAPHVPHARPRPRAARRVGRLARAPGRRPARAPRRASSSAPARGGGRAAVPSRVVVVAAAAPGGGVPGDDASGGAPSASSPAAAGQESIEAIEARLKGRRSKPKEGYFDSYPTKPSDEPLGLWETDPAAWDAKPGFEKLWSAWSGEPGMMYWMNRGAWFGAAALAFAWVLFRLVGPALGLYQLN